MQPMPTTAHPGPAEPESSGSDSTPVHGTAVPSLRHALAANPITEATTEMPLIVPNSVDRPGPSPLPPIATQLLGGVAPPAGPAPEAETAPDVDDPQAEVEPDTDTDDPRAEPATDDPQAEVEPAIERDADDPQAGTDTVEGSEAGAAPGGPDTVEHDTAQQDTTQQDTTASLPEQASVGQDGELVSGPGQEQNDEQPVAGGADDDSEQAVSEADPVAAAAQEAGAADEGSDHPADDAQPDDVTDQPTSDVVGTAADRDRPEEVAQDEADGADEQKTVTTQDDADGLPHLDDEYDTEDQPEDAGSEDDEDEEPAAVLTTVDEQVESASAEAAAEAPTSDSERSVAKRPGDVSMPPITIWSETAADDLRDEWHEIKARFVDEPEVAVAQAQSLVAHTVRTLAERLLAEQVELDPHRHSEAPDTESMRMALRHYREFLDRLLAI
jgi:hypothetical protein